MTEKELKEARLRWQSLCDQIQASTELIEKDYRAQQERISRAKDDYGYFVKTYLPHYASCDCADFQIKAAEKVRTGTRLKGVFMWPRGHAKSINFDIGIPMWLKIQGMLHVMVLVGKSEDSAKILLSDLQAEFEANQLYIHDFGPQKAAGSWEEGNFVTADGVAFFARGRGQSPRGLRYRSNRPDYIVVDDLDDDELCESPARVRKLTEWVKTALYGAMDSGRGRFVMVGNLISRNSVLQQMTEGRKTYVSRITAIMPDGTPAWPQKNTIEELRDMEEFMGYRNFQKEYMNNPVTEGAVFKQEWIRYGRMLPLEDYDDLVCYIDPSFKDSKTADYKAAKLWGRKGSRLHHIRAFVRQCSIVEMVRWLYDLEESMPPGASCKYLMETNFLQDTILDEFETEGDIRGWQLPITGDKRSKPNKFLRIENISPLWERGFVTYNEEMKDDPDMKTGIEQTLAFEKGSRAHDDAPDADEGAIYTLRSSSKSQTIEPLFSRISNIKESDTW